MALTREQQIAALEKDWAENPRWKGVTRDYSAADVVRLRGSVQPEHTFAKLGAENILSLSKWTEEATAIIMASSNN